MTPSIKENIVMGAIIGLIIIGSLVLMIYNNEKEIEYLNDKYDDMFDDINNIRVRLNTLQMNVNETDFKEYFDRCHDRREGYVC